MVSDVKSGQGDPKSDVKSGDGDFLQSVDCISKYYIANTLGRDVSFVIPDPVKVKGYDMKILDSVEKGLELQPPKCLDNVVPPLAKTSETMIVSDQDACVHGYQESELVVGLEGVQCQE
jgi:hypothetical protein